MMSFNRSNVRWRLCAGVALCFLLTACGGHTQQQLPATPNAVGHRVNVASEGTGCSASTISANFNGTSIPSGYTIWFTSVIKAQGLANMPVMVNMSNASVSFTAGGTPYTISVPNFAVTFNPSATTATLSYNGSSWTESVPSSIGGNVLMGAVAFPVSTNLPGGIQNVTWTGTFSSTQQSGLKLNWAWSAAVYSQFNSDYTQLGVKPVDDNKADPSYPNSDHAGTPESDKSYVTGGAMGGGGSNYTGGLSGTLAVVPCQAPSLLLVSNQGSNTIEAFPTDGNGNISPTYIISGSNTELFTPGSMAEDHNGNVWVSTCVQATCNSNDPAAIRAYPSTATGNASPITSLVGPDTELQRSGGQAFDSQGNLYVANEFAQFEEFAAGATGDAAPTATVTNTPAPPQNYSLGYVFKMQIGANGKVYALSDAGPFPGNGGTGQIAVYSPGANGAATPLAVLTGDFFRSNSFAIGSSGNFYVTGQDNSGAGFVETYSSGWNGSASPTQKISGSNTGLGDGLGIAQVLVDETSGKIYVTNQTTNGAIDNSILVFPIGTSGNIAPSAVITGSNTGLNEPAGIIELH